tara:strand:- start:2161 stop:2736 length:576 start_codon:yes stop_codon:yes gene_type:complete
MKKIEAIINRKNYPIIRSELDGLGIEIIDKRNLEDSKFITKSTGSRAGGTGVRSTMLAKIELAMQDKDARSVLEMISKFSGLPANMPQKIFVFDMNEMVDGSTLEGQSDMEIEQISRTSPRRFVTKRNRLVPLQKRTLYKLEEMYDNNTEILETDYRIKSFADFVNYCIMKQLPTMEKQLDNPTILYEDNF